MGVTDLGGKPGDDSAVILSSRMDPEFTRKTQNDPVYVQRQIGDGSHRQEASGGTAAEAIFIKSIYYDDKSKDLMAIHSLIVVVSKCPAIFCILTEASRRRLQLLYKISECKVKINF